MQKLLILLLIANCLLLPACNREDAGQNNGKPRIALVVKTLNNPFFLDMKKGAEEAAGTLGVDLIVQAAERETDVEKQMQIIENLIQIQVDALCITPSGSRELMPVIAKANKAHIPVLIVDSRLDEAAAEKDGVHFATFIGSDNYQGGKIAGEYAAKIFNGSANLVVLEGIPGHETGDSRLRGFYDGIAGHANLKIIASQPANWERDQGFNVMQNLLQAHRNIDGVFACNDMMALGAMEAIAASAQKRPIKIFGFDAVDEARQEIDRGTMQASVAQNPQLMGKLAIENAVKLLHMEEIPSYVPVDIQLVTKP